MLFLLSSLPTWEEAAGAVSLLSMNSAVPLGSRMSMKAPPPIPLAMGLMTPRQKTDAMAASTALPPDWKGGTKVSDGVWIGHA